MGLGGIRTFIASTGGGGTNLGPGTVVGAQNTTSILMSVANPGISNILSATLLISPIGATAGFLKIDSSIDSGASPGLIGQFQAYPVAEKTSAIFQITGSTTQVPGGTLLIQVNQSSGTTSGYLSFTDWTTFNSKQPAIGYTATPQARVIGTTWPLLGGGDLSTDRQLSIQAANGTTGGFLTAADWTTFNNKQDLLKIGPLSASSFTNGATLFGPTFQLGPADGTNPGSVTIVAQTFAGNKTFLGFINSPVLQIQGASSGFVSLIAGASLAGYTLTMPIAQGGASTVFMNNGTGGMTWTTLGAAGFGATTSLLLFGASSGVLTQSVGTSFASYSVTLPLAQGATYSAIQNNGQGVLGYSAIITPVIGYTAVFSNLGTVGVFKSEYQQIMDKVFIKGYVTIGVPGAAPPLMSLPIPILSSSIGATSLNNYGTFFETAIAIGQMNLSTAGMGVLTNNGASNTDVAFSWRSSLQVFTLDNANTFAVTGDLIAFDFSYRI